MRFDRALTLAKARDASPQPGARRDSLAPVVIRQRRSDRTIRVSSSDRAQQVLVTVSALITRIDTVTQRRCVLFTPGLRICAYAFSLNHPTGGVYGKETMSPHPMVVPHAGPLLTVQNGSPAL